MNGLLIVDKPGGMTSHDVVSRVRRAAGEQSIGHLGTLDPMATGVLPLLLGKYTRLAQFFGPMPKTYTGSIRFGFATDTYDKEGTPAGAEAPLQFTSEELFASAAHFSGEMEQMPPPYSAKKIGGKPAHKIARAGEIPQLKPARITIFNFEITSFAGDTADFRISVSSGGYVRAVAHDLGQRLGCGAHLSSLRRVTAGPFGLEEALTLQQVEQLAHKGNLSARMPHPRLILPDLPAVTADAQTVGRLRNGAAVNLPEFGSAPLVKIFEGQRELVAIGRRIAGTLFQPIAVIG
ncbi:MAG: tRNA pseudouridine(55) synthase TruB [Acidobacteria bacterium]|nr:tRNA pseudouridine(55) synthase TruB [Acidobacteriota bacterium]MBW4044286.1 tRNA pseudouridine(55) synthase TruB [Acidobacteriota bacterium]